MLSNGLMALLRDLTCMKELSFGLTDPVSVEFYLHEMAFIGFNRPLLSSACMYVRTVIRYNGLCCCRVLAFMKVLSCGLMDPLAGCLVDACTLSLFKRCMTQDYQPMLVPFNVCHILVPL